MRPVSAGFLSAVTRSHLIAVRATVVETYQEGVSPTGTQVDVITGDVTLDSTADVRGTLDITLDGTRWDPRPGNHLIQPYGNELYIERGVYVNGSVEWVGQGYYKMQTVEQATAPDGNLQVTASDRMQTIVDAQLPIPRSYSSSNTVADVFDDLVLSLYPDATIVFDYSASGDTLGAGQVTDTDRHGFLADLCTSRGKIMFWDYQGQLQVMDAPDTTTSLATVGAGKNGILISADRTLTRQGVNNQVVVTSDGANTTAAALANAFDNNPASPTYFYGPYGQVPMTFSSPLITNYDAAAAAAVLILQKAITLPLQANLTAVPNPALEPLDVITVDYGPNAAGVDLAMVIDTLTIPLNATDPWEATVHDPAPLQRIQVS